MNDLRARLSYITENGDPDGHPRLIEQLRQTHPHSIEVTESPAPIDRYTCAVHAFHLVEDEEYEAIVMASPRYVFASPGFVQRLISRGTLVRVGQLQAGAVVVYRSEGVVKHIGRVLSPDRVESKWGIGHLYKHGLYEVPLSYGDAIEFFHGIDRDTALDELVEFAKENGVQFSGDA